MKVIRGRPMLAAIRPQGKPEGTWALPKGNLDPGERPEETALREVFEETGVHGRLVEKLGDVDRLAHGSNLSRAFAAICRSPP